MRKDQSPREKNATDAEAVSTQSPGSRHDTVGVCFAYILGGSLAGSAMFTASAAFHLLPERGEDTISGHLLTMPFVWWIIAAVVVVLGTLVGGPLGFLVWHSRNRQRNQPTGRSGKGIADG